MIDLVQTQNILKAKIFHQPDTQTYMCLSMGTKYWLPKNFAYVLNRCS